ncbi:MAG: hypothetical protein Q7J21_02815 [Rugosibacter sp.]|nr:hypothetical protein [Rugosibacter sp.]
MLGWLGKKKDAGWTAIDVGSDGVHGVSVLAPRTPGDKPRVVKCGAMPGQRLDADTLIRLARKISVPGCPWTLPLSRKEYNLLVVQEPTVQPDEFEQSMRWSISTLIDYPVDEANIAWMKIPTVTLLPNRPPQMYVVVVKSEIVAWYSALFQQAKVPLQAISVRETAQRNIAVLGGGPGEGTGLLSIGKHGVYFTATFNGELYLDRFVEESLFVAPLTDAAHAPIEEERACERIVLQVQRSLDFISRNLQFIDINRLLMAPMPAYPDMGDFISQHIQVPVEALDLASIFDFSQTPELALRENQAPYFFALGAALQFMENKA